MKFRVIEGGRDLLEDRILKEMMRGRICQEELDRLRPKGDLQLVKKPPNADLHQDDWPLTQH